MKGVIREEEKVNVWDCGSPLYDSYELVSLIHVIDRHTMILPSLTESSSSSSSSHASVISPSSVFLGSSSGTEEASKKKEARRGSSCVFLSGIWSWKRRKVCDEKEIMKAKKAVSLKLSDGICRVYNRISSLGKNRSV